MSIEDDIGWPLHKGRVLDDVAELQVWAALPQANGATEAGRLQG